MLADQGNLPRERKKVWLTISLSTAVVQRSIAHILSSAKSQHVATQNAALDILTFTVNQGLYHPLQVGSTGSSSLLTGSACRFSSPLRPATTHISPNGRSNCIEHCNRNTLHWLTFDIWISPERHISTNELSPRKSMVGKDCSLRRCDLTLQDPEAAEHY